MTVTAIGGQEIANDGEFAISASRPYTVAATIEGVSPILFHRWSNEDVAAKAKASKNSRAKKSDNLEAYVYRTPEGNIAVPGEYIRGSLIGAAKFQQDPRSPRKSAMDLFKAGVIVTSEMCDTGQADWDYIDRRRVMIQRNGVTRERPALTAGWSVTCDLLVNLPEYIDPAFLHTVLVDAGRLVGIADYRPTYGRFSLIRWEVQL